MKVNFRGVTSMKTSLKIRFKEIRDNLYLAGDENISQLFVYLKGPWLRIFGEKCAEFQIKNVFSYPKCDFSVSSAETRFFQET